VELAKKTMRECLIFKVYFEKSYDSVDWAFLNICSKDSDFVINGLIGFEHVSSPVICRSLLTGPLVPR
jgi:hypothetical protein